MEKAGEYAEEKLHERLDSLTPTGPDLTKQNQAEQVVVPSGKPIANPDPKKKACCTIF